MAIANSKETTVLEEDEIAAAHSLASMLNETPLAELVDGPTSIERERPAEVTEQQKMSWTQKSRRPNKQKVDVQFLHSINCAIESFGGNSGKATLPRCMKSVDASFFTDEMKAPNGKIQWRKLT